MTDSAPNSQNERLPWPVAEGAYRPYTEHERDGRSQVFVQWKGTDACFDFWCECGAGGHFDGYFAYAVRCPGCGAVYAMPSTIYLVKRDVVAALIDPVTPDDGIASASPER